MSLEATLIETNTLLKQLIAVVTTGVEVRTTLGEPEAAAPKATRTRKAREEVPIETAETTEKHPLGLVDGDPEGTRYWVSEQYKTAFAQKPGDPDPKLADIKIVTAAHYLERKAEFTKNSPVVGAQTTESAATPAAPTPAASTASSEKPADEVPFAKIIERITVLNKSTEVGHGREGVMAILKKYLPDDAKPSVTKLQPLGKNAEVLADIEAALSGGAAAEEEFDPLA